MSENGNHPTGTELEPSSGVVEALPGLARVAAGAWIRTAAWGVGKSLELGARVARAATSPDQAAQLAGVVAHAGGELTRELGRLVGRGGGPGHSGTELE